MKQYYACQCPTSKVYWVGVVWVEPVTTSKPHQRKISTEGILGQYPSGILGEHCLCILMYMYMYIHVGVLGQFWGLMSL